MNLIVAVFVSILSAAVPTSAVDVSVLVVDAAAAPVANATVTAASQSCRTGADGRCALKLAPRAGRVQIAADGFASRTVEVDLSPGAAQALEVTLVPRQQYGEQVDVVESAPSDRPARIPVKPVEVMEVAGGVENVFRVLHTLPGVASPEEFGSRLSVRGGGPDENLTILDGVEIHNPYRLFGLVSAFNPETIEAFDLSTGAFDARHGDRLSSLLLIRARPGTTEQAIAGTAALGLTDSNVVAEGRSPAGSGSWLLAVRRTYYDLVAERFIDEDLPSFTDVQAKAFQSLGRGASLTVFGLRSRESADATFDEPEQGAEGAFNSRTRNDLVAATLTLAPAAGFVTRTIASSYVNTEAVDFGGDFRNKGRRANAPGDVAYDQSRVEVTWEGRVRDHALRQELAWQASPHRLFEAGFEAHALETRVQFLIPAERNTQEGNTSSLQGGAGLPDVLDSRRRDTRVGAWLQARLNLPPRWLVEPGVRVDRSTVNERTSVSPRVAATWSIGAKSRLRGAVGLYTQSPGYEKLVQSDYFMDLTATGPLDLDNERSRHMLLGLERDLAPGLTVRAEGYYKDFDRMVVGRLETAEETAARVAEYDFPAVLAADVPREPWITTQPTNGASGHAYGFDLYARRTGSASTRLTGWASYTYGIARREAYGLDYPFDYDRRHALSVVGNLRLSRKLVLSTTARFSSGFPRTPVVGLRVAGEPDLLDADRDGNRTELVPARNADGLLYYTTSLGGVANLNTARLPSYGRIDARLTYKPKGPNGRLQLYIDVINLLNRKNAGFLEPVLEYDATSDRPRLTEERNGSIPFLPSFGIHIDLARKR
jgi:hypothetical protein